MDATLRAGRNAFVRGKRAALARAIRAATSGPRARFFGRQLAVVFALAGATALFRLPPSATFAFALAVFAVSQKLGLRAGLATTCLCTVLAAVLESDRPTWLFDASVRFATFAALAFFVENLVARLEESAAVALHDPLTGALNRLGFFRRAEPAAEAAALAGEELVVGVIDLDDFKLLNDVNGHAFGDAILKTFVACTIPATASGGLLGRSGGDEFVLLARGLPVAAVEASLARAANRFSDASLVLGHRAGFTVGLAAASEHGYGLQRLFSAADAAMYKGKAGSRVRVA